MAATATQLIRESLIPILVIQRTHRRAGLSVCMPCKVLGRRAVSASAEELTARERVDCERSGDGEPTRTGAGDEDFGISWSHGCTMLVE